MEQTNKPGKANQAMGTNEVSRANQETQGPQFC